MHHNIHIIQRQVIDLRLSSGANRPAVQQRLERMLEEELLPRLERVFDRIAGPDVWVEMDKLEVDIGRLSPNGGNRDWLEQAHSAFVAAIEAQIKKSSSKPSSAPTLEILDYFLQHSYLPWWVEKFDLEETVRKELPVYAGRIARLFDNPLQRRRWVEQAGDDLQAALLQAAAGASLPFHPAQWQALLPQMPPLQARQLFWESIWEAVPHGGDLVKNWLDILFQRTLGTLGTTTAAAVLQTRIRHAPDWPQTLKGQLITQLETYGGTEIIPVETWVSLLPNITKMEAQQIYETAFREYRQQAGGTWVQHLLRHTIATLPDEQAVQVLEQNIRQSAALPEALKKELAAQIKAYAKAEKRAKTLLPLETWQSILPMAPKSEVQQLYRESLAALLQQRQEDWIQLLVRRSLGLLPMAEAKETFRWKIGDSAALSSVVKKQLLEALEQAASAAADTLRRERTSLNKMAEAEGLYVPLAGIVLLHPFLPTLFERSGLLENESFRDAAAQERAVHLLYFLATGQQHPPESELPLLKMLCGWDIEAPISRFIDLNDPEIQEATAVLEAAIAQWNALEGTTPDELRSGFLIREGKLQRGDLGWNLTVEQKGYDIIMNQLPWGLSPILHPWMREMLWVDWA